MSAIKLRFCRIYMGMQFSETSQFSPLVHPRNTRKKREGSSAFSEASQPNCEYISICLYLYCEHIFHDNTNR